MRRTFVSFFSALCLVLFCAHAAWAIGIAGRLGGDSSRASNVRNRVSDARNTGGGNRAGISQPNRNTGANANNRANISRPNLSGNTGNASRPSISRPGNSTPSLGGGQANRPSINRPSIDRPSVGANRPSVTRPGSGGGATTLPIENRPRPLPSVPDLGAIGGNRPGVGGNRPSLPSRPGRPGGDDFLGIDRPNRPDGPITLPGFVDRPGGGNRPGIDRPNRPDRPITLPGVVDRPTRPDRPITLPGVVDRPGGGTRPGIDRPNRPDRPITLPGVVDRPSRPGPITLPGFVDRPGGGTRPGIDRPNRPNRPDWNARPERPVVGGGNRPNVNINIHRRPTWVNISNDRLIGVNTRWNTAITTLPGNIHDWRVRRPDRVARWRFWGNSVRFSWGHVHVGVFGPSWWAVHRPAFGGWHHWHNWQRYSWMHWWGRPTFVDVSGWFRWRAPAVIWKQPIFYDFGPGGNVVFNDNRVIINGTDVGTRQEFAQSAAALATVEPPADEEEADAAEWIGLGTFAVSASEDEGEPTRLVQLAVNRDGVISGTWFNTLTDTAQSVLGQVDPDTQRAAFRIGEHDDVIVETGLYNLTLDEAPVLVHFGDQQQEFFLLIRMESPDEDLD